MLKKPLKLAVTLLLGPIVVACDGSTTSRQISQQPQRDGTTLESISVKYTDVNPALSATLDDGSSHLVLISGRDSTDTVSTLKAYKATWPAGGVPSALTRVTAEDLGREREAILSPNGQWVVLTVTSGQNTDLYLTNFAGTLTLRLTEDTAIESPVVFSPDSQFIGWISSEPKVNSSSAWMMAIGDGTESTLQTNLASKVKISADSEVLRDLFFVPPTDDSQSGYRLVTAVQAGANGESVGSARLIYSVRTFSALAEAASAATTALITDIKTVEDVRPFAAASKILFARSLIPATSKTAPSVGALDLKSQNQYRYVKSEPVFVSADGATAEQAYAEPPGTDTLGLGLSTDGETAFLLQRHEWRCTEAEGFKTGTSLGLAPATPPTTEPAPVVNEDGTEDAVRWDVVSSRLVPRYIAAESRFELATSLCDDATRRVDDKLQAIALSPSATATSYRLLYVTGFTTAFDEACQLKKGDAEVYAVEVDGETRTVTALSQNPAPITSSPRTGDACVL